MNSNEFVRRIEDAAKNHKTIYIKGCFGAPMNATNKKRYTTNLTYNANRAAMINACSADTFGFDCVCLIKGILWGWNADPNKTYGGAVYKSNGVPDVGADGIVKYLIDCTTDFSNIIPGECVWMQGHVGVYVGNGKVIECTPKWTNDVQYSNLGNIGYKTGNYRIWTKHGKLPWVEYVTPTVEEKPQEGANTDAGEVYYTVRKGDTFSKIAMNVLLALNPQITNPSKIYVGQKIRVR